MATSGFRTTRVAQVLASEANRKGGSSPYYDSRVGKKQIVWRFDRRPTINCSRKCTGHVSSLDWLRANTDASSAAIWGRISRQASANETTRRRAGALQCWPRHERLRRPGLWCGRGGDRGHRLHVALGPKRAGRRSVCASRAARLLPEVVSVIHPPPQPGIPICHTLLEKFNSRLVIPTVAVALD